jgi:hypothetical protein
VLCSFEMIRSPVIDLYINSSISVSNFIISGVVRFELCHYFHTFGIIFVKVCFLFSNDCAWIFFLGTHYICL